MMQEIYQRGPIACGIADPQSLKDYTGGIYIDETGNQDISHIISVVGWGEDEDGTKYWHVRNSWGTHWGEDGFVRVIRGINNIAIESDCSWAVPLPEPTVHKTTQEEIDDPRNDFYNPSMPQPELLGISTETCNRVPKNLFKNGVVLPKTLPWE